MSEKKDQTRVAVEAAGETPVGDAMTLPGEPAVDERLLDQAVAEINRLYIAKGLEMARALGSYVVKIFFDDDLDAFLSREKKHATFRALAQREDLQVAYGTIWYSMAVLEQLRRLPDDIAEALPLTHHKLLLPVKNDATRVLLAKRAIDRGLPSRSFAEVVKEARRAEKDPSRSGRPALPAFVKGLSRLEKAIELANSEEIDNHVFASYSPTEARNLTENIDRQVASLKSLKEKVLTAVKEFEDSIKKQTVDD